LALDVYCWLAYRLHVLSGPTPITWKALKDQFGQGFGRLDHFRRQFRQTLDLALSVYPAAKVEVHDRGITLHPSPAPIATKPVRLVAVGRQRLKGPTAP